MNYALAVLALSAACVAWYLVQRFAAPGEGAECDECERPGCAARGRPDPDCPEERTPDQPR